jgi:malonyl CoA-acyl carrier protein transacylase/SAM-dependent methyltransferase
LDCESTCKALGLSSLFPMIFGHSPIEDLVSLHCILFSIQYASAMAWIDSGLKVELIIGHSFGQLTGLCVAGSLSLSDAMTLISQRATLIKSDWGLEHGSMLSMKGTHEDVRGLVEFCNNSVDIACFNGPRDLVVAGDEVSITNIETIAAGGSMFIQTKRLRSTHAFHSRLVDGIVPGLTEVAQSLEYRKPRIPIEACSESGDWTSVTPTKIVQHSRMPVYFESAVKRAAEKVSGPAIWLEAGSGSPVIPMIRQIIQSSESPEGHVFQSTNLHDSQAQRNIAKATSNLWSKGVEAQFWAFSHHQAPSYRLINLPPYQFAKTKHWIPFDPSAFLPVAPPPLPDNNSGLVKVVEQSSRDTVFSVNVSHPVYRLCAEGHSVVGQHLCPASLYIEIILEAASKVASDGLSGLMPHVQNLRISAPLLLESEGQVCLRLSQADTQLKWSFSLFTRQMMSGLETHATGEIGLHNMEGASQASSRFRSLDRLVTPSRSQAIAMSSDANGLMGLPVYQTFNRVVEYADYFRGVKNVFASGHEATGLVSLEHSPSANCICDPVLVDNFLQVAGIHTNCLSETHDDEVFVCSGIEDIFLSDAFINRDTKSTETTTTYTSYDRPSKKQFMSDIFVFDSESGKLLLAIMSATFTSVIMSNLSRALRRLNKDAPELVLKSSERKPQLETQAAAMTDSHTLQQEASVGRGHIGIIQEMFHALLGIPLEELLPSSGLEDIGVDSLMRTEVLAEIKKRFNFNLSVTALMEISDIQGLANTIFQDASLPTLTVSASVDVPIEAPVKKMLSQVSQMNAAPDTDDSLADLSRDVFAQLKTTTAHSQKTKWNGFCDSVYPQQMALVTAYVVEAFQDMGIPLESVSPGQVIPELPVLPQHRQVKNQLYAILEYSKLVQRQENSIVRTKSPIPTTPSSALHEQIIRKYPGHESEHNLLRTTGSQLARCLTGAADPLALLFQDKQARELIGSVYTHAPMFLSATMHLTQLLRDVLSKADPSRKIKILEIGAGTGGTTGFLLGQLADVSGLRFQYTFTDISSSLIALARKRFQKYDFMQYTTLNVDQDPPEAMLGQYDVVISSNCVHATPSIMRSTKNIKSLLRPDGILCLIELTRNLFWFDLVFGLLEGWWMFDDGRQHALASEFAWKKALCQAGYRWVDWSSNPSKESEILRLIVASPANVGVQESGLVTEESLTFAEKDGVQLQADIYYPQEVETSSRSRPIGTLSRLQHISMTNED